MALQVKTTFSIMLYLKTSWGRFNVNSSDLLWLWQTILTKTRVEAVFKICGYGNGEVQCGRNLAAFKFCFCVVQLMVIKKEILVLISLVVLDLGMG